MMVERKLTSSLLVSVNVARQLDPTRRTRNVALATTAAELAHRSCRPMDGDTRTFDPEVPQLNDSVTVIP